MDDRPIEQARRPQSEPEIIPPGAPLPHAARIWIRADQNGRHRVYAARLGPVAVAFLVLTIGVLAAVLLLVLIGAALIWAAALGLIIAGAIAAGALRERFRRWR